MRISSVVCSVASLRVASLTSAVLWALLGCNGTPLVRAVNADLDPPVLRVLPPPPHAQREPDLISETFLQAQRPGQVDILWIIDDSHSMEQEQTLLADNAAFFMDQLLRNFDLDFKIAVTGTSVNEPPDRLPRNGAFVSVAGYPSVLTRGLSSADLLAAFRGMVTGMGTNHGPFEQGLEAARIALAPNSEHPQNEGFIRENALLSIIIVSDENDVSYLDGPWPTHDPSSPEYYVSRYVSSLSALKPKPSDIHFTTIILPGDGDCETLGCDPIDPYSDARGTQYRDALQMGQALGWGVLDVSIREPSWGEMLNHLGNVLAGEAYTSFPLTHAPIPDSILVEVNGETIPQRSDTWAYDRLANEIRFAPESTPPSGSTIVVWYGWSGFSGTAPK